MVIVLETMRLVQDGIQEQNRTERPVPWFLPGNLINIPTTKTTTPNQRPCNVPLLTSIPLELLLKISSFLDPLTVVTLIHTNPRFSGLFSVFTRQYHREQDVSGCSYPLLQYIILRGIEQAVAHILSIGADPNATASINPKFQKPPLIHAVCLGRASPVSLLLLHGARVDERGYRGCSNFNDAPLPSALV